MKGLRRIIEKTPILGSIANYILNKTKGSSNFTTSGEYWENRYQSKGNSGAGSYDLLAEFKADILNDFVEKKNIETVIEFGSGDGNQLKYFNFKSYIGFDISETIVAACRNLYKSDATKRFEVLTAYNQEKADLVLSLDVIYHLVEDSTFFAYMEKLFQSSKKYVIIYSSNDEFENKNFAAHVRHRKFTNWIEKNATNFKLVEHIPNKYRANSSNDISSFVDFFIFEIQD